MIGATRRQLADFDLVKYLRTLRATHSLVAFVLDFNAQMLAVALEADVRAVFVALVLFVGHLGESIFRDIIGADNAWSAR